MSKTIKEVKLPKYENVPRWLVIQGEMDLRLYILENMLKKAANKSVIAEMIDKATGYDQHLNSQAEELIAECRWLKLEYDKETGDV